MTKKNLDNYSGLQVGTVGVPLLLALACGGGGSQSADAGSPDATPDTTAPQATLSPGSGDTDVERRVTITVTFNEDMNASTIDTDSFTLVGDNGSVPGTVEFDESTQIATFVSTEALAMRAVYNASLSTLITDLAGNSLEALSAEFTVRDGRWNMAESAEDNDEVTGAGNPQLVFDSDGSALAVWRLHDGTGRGNIWSNRYSPNSGWGTAVLIETNDDADATRPQIAMDSSGNAIVTWQQGRDLWSNRYVVGTGWGTALVIDNAGGGLEDSVLASDAAGNAFAVWRQNGIGRNDIWFNRYIANEGWGTAALLENDDAGSAAGPSIATDAAGNAIAVWRQSDGTTVNMMARVYSVASGWGDVTLIESDDTGNAIQNQIGMDAAGNALVVWRQHDGTRNNIWATRYSSTEGWGTPGLLETDDTGNTDTPQISVEETGVALAVWHQDVGASDSFWSSHYSMSSGWSAPVKIAETDTGYAGSARVSTNAEGDAMVTWYQSDGIRTNIHAVRYRSDLGWEDALLLETDNEGSTDAPQIAIDSDGSALAIWSQWDGTRTNIMSNRFD